MCVCACAGCDVGVYVDNVVLREGEVILHGGWGGEKGGVYVLVLLIEGSGSDCSQQE